MTKDMFITRIPTHQANTSLSQPINDIFGFRNVSEYCANTWPPVRVHTRLRTCAMSGQSLTTLGGQLFSTRGQDGLQLPPALNVFFGGLASLWMASGQNQAAVLAEQVLDVLRRQQAHLLRALTTLAEAWLDCPMISV